MENTDYTETVETTKTAETADTAEIINPAPESTENPERQNIIRETKNRLGLKQRINYQNSREQIDSVIETLKIYINGDFDEEAVRKALNIMLSEYDPVVYLQHSRYIKGDIDDFTVQDLEIEIKPVRSLPDPGGKLNREKNYRSEKERLKHRFEILKCLSEGGELIVYSKNNIQITIQKDQSSAAINMKGVIFLGR